MTKQNTYKKSNTFMIVLIVALVAAAVIVFSSNWKISTKPLSIGPAINNSQDLDAASKDLDSADMNQFNNDLNQLKTDSSAF